MEVETKEVITLTNEEKEMINRTYDIMCEIMELTNNAELHEVIRNILNFMDEFENKVDCETDK